MTVRGGGHACGPCKGSCVQRYCGGGRGGAVPGHGHAPGQSLGYIYRRSYSLTLLYIYM